MHEMSIAEGILDILRKEREKHNLKKISCAKLKIGLLTMVVPEALTFCFEVLTKDTPFEGITLNIEMVPIKAKCKNCGCEFVHEDRMDFFFMCPECGGELEVIKGNELFIEEIEGEK